MDRTRAVDSQPVASRGGGLRFAVIVLSMTMLMLAGCDQSADLSRSYLLPDRNGKAAARLVVQDGANSPVWRVLILDFQSIPESNRCDDLVPLVLSSLPRA